MTIIKATKHDGEVYYFGPFPVEERAVEYSASLDGPYWNGFEYLPLVVPNCIGVNFTIKY